MTARLCIPWPAQVLRQPAADVAEITDEVRAIWADMVETMEAMPGYGLAAVQIGAQLPVRLDLDKRLSLERYFALIQPVIDALARAV